VITHPATGVVVGVMNLEPDRDQALLAAGARMVVPLTTDESELRAALRLVARGLVGPPRVTAAAAADGLALLTDRETEVFELLLRRRTAREIAEVLHIAVPTVNAHTRRIYDKLGVHNRAELEDRAGRAGRGDPTPPERRQRNLSRERVSFGGRSSQSRNGARPSALDMRAAMGVARWPRQS
jgi:DNA-binding NarL/FixJ family response regulator